MRIVTRCLLLAVVLTGLLLTVSAAAQRQHILRDAAGNPLSVRSVQQGLETLGFTFESSPLADGTPRMLGQQSTTIVELYGDTHLVQAVLLGIASQDDHSVNLVIISGIAGLLKATVPSKVEWVAPAMKRAISRAERSGTGTVSTSAANVVVSMTVNSTLGSYVLIVQHPLNDMERGG